MPRPPGRHPDVVPHQVFRPVRLFTLLSWAREDVVTVLGVLSLDPPLHKVSDHFLVQRKDLLAFLRLHRPNILVPHGTTCAGGITGQTVVL